MSTAARSLTAEEYLAAPPVGRNTELVRGAIVDMSPGGFRHGEAGVRVGRILDEFAERHDLGRVSGHDVTVVTARDPDTVRGADVAFYTFEQVPPHAEISGVGPPPHLVVEVRSPNDRRPELIVKAGEYLAAGVRGVVVFDPENLTANVFTPDEPVGLHTADEIVVLPAPLQELRLTVREWLTRPSRTE